MSTVSVISARYVFLTTTVSSLLVRQQNPAGAQYLPRLLLRLCLVESLCFQFLNEPPHVLAGELNGPVEKLLQDARLSKPLVHLRPMFGPVVTGKLLEAFLRTHDGGGAEGYVGCASHKDRSWLRLGLHYTCRHEHAPS